MAQRRFGRALVHSVKAATATKANEVSEMAILILLTTPYSIGTVLAMLLNAILPTDMEVVGYSSNDGGKA